MPSRPRPETPALLAALDRYRTSLADAPVRSVLVEHSHLPGPRGNLELAARFAEEVAERAAQEPAPWWDLCSGLAGLSARRAPAGDPAEFVAFCGTVGAAAVACLVEDRTAPALDIARGAAADPRWRLREAAAMALQRLLLARRKATLTALESWVRGGRPLELRAVVAALAEPSVLAVDEIADAAVTLHREVLARLLATGNRTSTSARTLRQALGYTLSVVTIVRPEAGFALLEELLASHDGDGLWIARENLRKARLARHFPERTKALQRRSENVRG
jgi:hypothetical protein